MAYVVSIGLVLLVLALYGRSVLSSTRHSLRELVQFLTLLVGILFIGALLVLLYVQS